MGLFDFLKKKNQNNEKAALRESGKVAAPAVFGVEDIFQLNGTADVVLAGSLTGTVKRGDTLAFVHGGKEISGRVVAIEAVPQRPVDSLSDAPGALKFQVADTAGLKKGAVLFNTLATDALKKEVYVNTIGTTFVGRQQGVLTPEDAAKASAGDLAEILRLFIWKCQQLQQGETAESHEENIRKINQLTELLRDKLLASDRLHLVFSKKTGAPHLFSETIDQQDGTYFCTDPLLQIVSEEDVQAFRQSLPADSALELREIHRGEDGQGIVNALGDAFYVDGATGVFVRTLQAVVPAKSLVPEPDFSHLPKIEVPIANPNLVRWLLLMGQLGDVETEAAQKVYQIYYGFMTQELLTARLLLPTKEDLKFTQKEENGRGVLEEGSTFSFPVKEGKDGRETVPLFTDWKRLRMVYDDGWNGWINTVEDLISRFDCTINATEHLAAACYISDTVFAEIKERWDSAKKETEQ